MKPSTLLNISIPTYNRASLLEAQLERLRPQLTSEVHLSVYDNASTDETRLVLEKFDSPFFSFTSCQNNTGGNHNIFRCFEGCQSEWIWTLSDDDAISPTAIEDLLKIIKNTPADFVQTSSPAWRNYTDSIIDDISQLLFPMVAMSSCIYRLSAFRPLLFLYMESISTMVSTNIIVLALLENKTGKVFLSTLNLVTELPLPLPSWSTLNLLNCVSHAPGYLKEPQNQACFSQRIYNHAYYWALFIGIREVHDATSLQRWKRIMRIADFNLRSYGARSKLMNLIYTNQWYRKSCRKKMLLTIYYTLFIKILTWCPSKWFLPVYRSIPRPIWERDLMFPENMFPEK